MNVSPSSRTLVLTYLGLILLAALSWLTASLGTGTALALAIAALKALGIAFVFMELSHSHATDRIVACMAVLFVLLLCVGALGDVTFR